MFDEKIIKRLLPHFLRKPIQIAWLKALLSNALIIYNQFKKLRDDADNKRLFNSQTASLEDFLRTHFNEPLIQVINLQNQNLQTYIFFLKENQNQLFSYFLSEAQSPTYIFFQSEFADSNNYDFIVQVPSALSSSLSEIQSIVNCLRLASKRFKVVFV